MAGPSPAVEDTDGAVLSARELTANSEQEDSDSKLERSLLLLEPGSLPLSISGMDDYIVFGFGLTGTAT